MAHSQYCGTCKLVFGLVVFGIGAVGLTVVLGGVGTVCWFCFRTVAR